MMKTKSALAGVLAVGLAVSAGSAVAHEVIHLNHGGKHSEGDGHVAVMHAGHIDHLHDGHLHSTHGPHVDEHVIAISADNPAGEHKGDHGGNHVHAKGDDHAVIQHGDHFDHMHDGHLHHLHGDHTDEHGALNTVK